jgi:pimeloyl-ACP methyl ester carboxylesterase
MLIHAGVADRSMWREHLDWLAAAGFRAIAVDLPGFGEAEVAGGVQAPWEEVLQTARGLGLPRMALVGNSFGAAVALRVAVVAPAAVAALMVISPPPLELDPSPSLRAAWEAEEAALEQGDIDGAVSAILEAWLQPSAPPALRERVATMQRRAFELQRAATDVREAPDPLDRRAAVVQPVLVLRPASQPAAAPRMPPRLSRLALRRGLRWAFEEKPRMECRNVAFAALRATVLPILAIDASVQDPIIVYPAFL